MTREEAIKMAKADLKCMERDASGQDEMCNSHKCYECSLNYERGNMGEQKEWLRLAIQALEQEPKWIPVTERLPKEHLCNDGYIEPSDYVLVWGDHGSYGVSRYWGNRRSKSERPDTYRDWTDLEWVVEKPIAWMPLPEPYEGGREDDKA